MSDTFCPLPWIHLATKTNGDLRVCCQANKGNNRGLLRDEHGNVLNLFYDDIEDTRNASLIKEVRVGLMNGKKHPECRRCWDEEETGIKSKRMSANEIYGSDKQFYIENTFIDGTITNKVKLLDFDLRFGNLCNLKCVTCGPSDSSAWYDDFKKMHGELDTPITLQWPFRKEFWKDIEKQIPNMKHVFIIGGEPMLIKSHFDFLKTCIDKGYAQNISLEYSSNITNIHQKFFDLWRHFKKIKIGASIDGVGKLNDYIRYPSKWKSIEKNIKKLDDIPNIQTSITTTVSVFNIYYLDDLIKWKFEQKFKKINDLYSDSPIINSHALHLPFNQSIQIFPKKSKIIIANKLRLLYTWFDDFDIDNKKYVKLKLEELIEGYINYMMERDKSELIPVFLQITKHLDKIRNNNLDEKTYKLLMGE